jgi:hypothetical protein
MKIRATRSERAFNPAYQHNNAHFVAGLSGACRRILSTLSALPKNDEVTEGSLRSPAED